MLRNLEILYDLPTDKNTLLLDLLWPLGLALLAKLTAIVLFALLPRHGPQSRPPRKVVNSA